MSKAKAFKKSVFCTRKKSVLYLEYSVYDLSVVPLYVEELIESGVTDNRTTPRGEVYVSEYLRIERLDARK